jgi:hypothetical protein
MLPRPKIASMPPQFEFAAKRAACTAVKMLVVQDDCLEVVRIMGERMQGSRRNALVDHCVANLGGRLSM